MSYNRKGEIKKSIGSIIALVSGVGVAVLFLIFVGTLGSQTYVLVEDDIQSLTASVVNDSKTALLNTAVALSNDNIQTGTLTVLNSSQAVGIGNFTVDYDLGHVTLTGALYNNTALDFSYTHGDYEIQEAINKGMVSSFNALEQTGNYMPIIVLAIIISLVLFLVLGLSFKGTGGNTAL